MGELPYRPPASPFLEHPVTMQPIRLWITLVLLSGVTNAAKAESTDEFLQQLENRRFSGVVLIAQGDRVLNQRAYGFASCDNSTPNTPETVLAIGSITKMFTAAAIGHLAETGRLQIDGTLADYLDDIPDDKAAITIRQLLNHTSGLGTYHETTRAGDFEQQTREEALEVILRRRLRFAPGEREMYSNSGYTLLAIILEEVSGQSYTSYLRQHLLGPAGMTSTGFWGDRFAVMATSPNQLSGCSSPDNWQYSWVLVGNGGMVSTAADLHRWITALRGNRVLSEQAKTRVGLDRRLRGRFGEAGGSSQHEFNATLVGDGPRQITVVAISNRNTVQAEEIAGSLLKAAVNETTALDVETR